MTLRSRTGRNRFETFDFQLTAEEIRIINRDLGKAEEAKGQGGKRSDGKKELESDGEASEEIDYDAILDSDVLGDDLEESGSGKQEDSVKS